MTTGKILLIKKNISGTHGVLKGRRQLIIGEADLLSGYIFKALIFYSKFLIDCYLLLSVSDNLEVADSTAV